MTQPAGEALPEELVGMSVVVDVAGGDLAPAEPIAGALLAAKRFPDTNILLAGPEGVIRAALDRCAPVPTNIGVLHASESIGMHESPVQVLREKKDSSIGVGVACVARGEASAFVSAGNTGAVVAATSLCLGLLEGVQRPGIAIPIRALDHTVVIIDVGANMQCKPTHLLQYGIMATVFARDLLELENPRVGLLNVGQEERKGTTMLKEAFEMLSQANLEFVGNVEGHEIFFDACDIVVCDGFVGNVLLKTSEGVAAKLMQYFKSEIKKKLWRQIGFALCKDVFGVIRRRADYSQYGGALLLGVNGVTIISHGRSDATAIVNAVREARSFVRRGVNDKIAAAIRSAPLPNSKSDQKRPAPPTPG